MRYVNNAGIESEDPLSVILPHFFNHQTHHRAQVHTLLSQLGGDPPGLDLHRVLRPNPTSRSSIPGPARRDKHPETGA
jgi:uncharacterized damage-inducible protein DinB